MRRTLTAVAILAALFAGWIVITGGGRWSVAGLDIAATDPYRPLALAILVLIVRIGIGGATTLQSDIMSFRRALTPRGITAALAVAVVATGLLEGSNVAGGADSYGYVSEADLWLKGNLAIAQPDARKVPWPEGQWTFAPLGYRPSPSRDAIVPLYSPGLPLLLAGFKLVGGQCAIGWIVPLTAGLLIALTFAIGRRAASDEIGVAAAWLMATSPVLLYMVMTPMSDVPAAAFWALAAYGCLAGSSRGALLGGMAAAVAIAIRPNLVHVGVMMALWLAVRDARFARRPMPLARPALFALPVIAAALAIAALNAHLYGAATNSGYGSLGGIFSAEFVAINLVSYARWIAQSQTPLALAGLAAIGIPWSRVMPERPGLADTGLLALMSISIIATYLFYANFGAWWYLRFLLPMWMALCIGTAYLFTGRSGRSFTAIGKIVLVALGIYGMWFGQKEGVLDLGRNEQRYVRIARLVRDTTEPNAVIITLQHSGSVRYYGERTTLRYEVLSNHWLDRSIAWLHENGFHPYILLDNPEHEWFKERFAARNIAGNLDMAIVFEYRDRYNTSTFLYDPMQPSKLSSVPILVAAPRRETFKDCAPPAPAQAIFSMENARR